MKYQTVKRDSRQAILERLAELDEEIVKGRVELEGLLG